MKRTWLLLILLFIIYFATGLSSLAVTETSTDNFRIRQKNISESLRGRNSISSSMGTTKRVSLLPDGSECQDQVMQNSISADGRFVAFTCNFQIYVHDRSNGQVEMVSVASDGTPGNGGSDLPSLSEDGRYVAFTSGAENLIPSDNNGLYDVFLHDRLTGFTELISVASDGTQANRPSTSPSVSGNGLFVAFISLSTNLVEGDTNWMYDVFVHDRTTGMTERVSIGSDGSEGDADVSVYTTPALTPDGRFIAFSSGASNLVSGDTNFRADVFVHDHQAGLTERVSVSTGGAQAPFQSEGGVSISSDGRFVAFLSSALLGVGDIYCDPDVNGAACLDIYVHDRQTNVTELISLPYDGIKKNMWSDGPAISADGRHVAFNSVADNLVSGDTNLCDVDLDTRWNEPCPDIFVFDRLARLMERVSISSAGEQSNNLSRYTSISYDGGYVAYYSLAGNLVEGDSQDNCLWMGVDPISCADIFVHERMISSIPNLVMNYGNGAPGSYFNVTGEGFSPEQDASVSLNYVSLGEITTSISGTLTFTLRTSSADEGIYYVTVNAGAEQSATAKLSLDSDDPLRSQEGEYVQFEIPAGIAYVSETYLPLVKK